MLKRDDVIDIILERLKKAARGAAPARGRLFLSEYDIRNKLTANSQELRIPKDAIISPLASDWLALRRVKIVRE